jgi:uncharacterized protein involved in exopolysaccharide biosynthesis
MTDERKGSSSLPQAPTPREIAATLFRRPKLVAASFGLIFLAAMIAVLFSARYESHFKVLLRHGRLDPIISAQPSATDFTRPGITEEELNSEVELLRDEDLLKQVVVATAFIPSDTKTSDRSSLIERAVRKVKGRLNVEAMKKSNLIQVTYRDSDPDRAARFLAALSEAYTNRHMNLQRPSGEMQFFDEQTAQSEKRLHQAEVALVNFTTSRGVVSAAMERDIALQKLGEADAAYRALDQERVEVGKTMDSLREQLKTFPSRSVTLKRWADNPDLMGKLKAHLLELQLKRLELLTRYEPSYRLVKEVEQQINEARAAITAESLTPVRDETTDKDPNYEWARLELEKAQVKWDGLRAREAAALAQVSLLRGVAQQMQSSSVDQQDLIRTAKADEDAYLLYLHKREEARIGDALDQQRILNVAIVEPPTAPALPNRSALGYLLFAFGLSLVFSTGLCFLAEYFDATIRTPEEANSVLEIPVLAWLPQTEPQILNSRTARTSGPSMVIQ